MNLSSDLISQFAKITNDGNERKAEEVTLYGEIVQFGDSLCVKLDGSNEMTPAITTSTIKVGDRVSAVIKNHTAIITGNFSDPSASSEKLGKVGLEIDEKIGVIFTGLSEGTTVIDGSCIKTGTIDAKRLNLSGAITFEDLDEDLKNEIDNPDVELPDYITETYIDGAEIRSPTIYGGRIYSGLPDNRKGYSVMTNTGFEVFNSRGQRKIRLGYTADGSDYPYVELGAGNSSDNENTRGIIKKFTDGLWIGNSAAAEASGVFSPTSDYVGMFFAFTTGKAYVVQGTDMQNIYTGESIAKFG